MVSNSSSAHHLIVAQRRQTPLTSGYSGCTWVTDKRPDQASNGYVNLKQKEPHHGPEKTDNCRSRRNHPARRSPGVRAVATRLPGLPARTVVWLARAALPAALLPGTGLLLHAAAPGLLHARALLLCAARP